MVVQDRRPMRSSQLLVYAHLLHCEFYNCMPINAEAGAKMLLLSVESACENC